MAGSTSNTQEGQKRRGRLPRRHVCKKCKPPKSFKTPGGLRIHELNKHEGRGWSRKKRVINVSPVEVLTPKTLADVKHCPGCGAYLTPYRAGGPVTYCPVDGTPLHLWVSSVKFVDSMVEKGVPESLASFLTQLSRIL